MCPPLLAAIPLAASLGSALGTSAAAGGLLIASTAMSGIAAGMSYIGQKQAVDAQNSYQKYQYEETQRLANDNLLQQYRQLGLRRQEEQTAFAQQVQQIDYEGRQAMGQAAVRQGESGIYGNSFDALMMDFRRQQSEAVSNASLNYAMRDRQIGLEAQGFRSQAESQVIRATPLYQAQPSIVTPVLQTLGSGFGMAANLAGPNFLKPDGTTGQSSYGTYAPYQPQTVRSGDFSYANGMRGNTYNPFLYPRFK